MSPVLLLFAALQPLTAPADRGLFDAAELYLVRVTAVKVPDHRKLYGDSTLRVDRVLIGPNRLKGSVAVYKFFAPTGEIDFGGGSRYSGKYPDFAYPAPKGEARYWWASPDGDGWKTANFRRLARYLRSPAPELLLKAGLKPESTEAVQQQDLVDALIRLESMRTRIEQIAVLREMEHSANRAVSSTAEQTLKNLFNPPKNIDLGKEK